jgi:hypothetical protein
MMPSDKLTLNQNTSINDVNNYFENLDPGKQVRARKIGGGQIELYVRKDSFKQFFTDKLRLGFLVTRDYKEARELILRALEKAGLPKEELLSVTEIKQSIGLHKHDFYADKVSNEFKKLSKYIKEQTQAKEVIDSTKVNIKMPKDDENFKDPQAFKAYVHKLNQ